MSTFDPRGPAADPGPMTIEIPGKTARLLVSLAEKLGAKTPGEVVGQALGLLQMVHQAKSRGQRIVVKDPSGREIDLAL